MARKGLNIYKRKDGRWEARYIKSRNTQGKPRYGYLYATSYHKVRNNLQKVIQALNATDNEKVPATNYKFMDFSVIWLENPLTSLKESTYIRYRTLLNCDDFSMICRGRRPRRPRRIYIFIGESQAIMPHIGICYKISLRHIWLGHGTVTAPAGAFRRPTGATPRLLDRR